MAFKMKGFSGFKSVFKQSNTDDKLSIKAVEKHERHAATNPVDTTGLSDWKKHQAKIRKIKSDKLDEETQAKKDSIKSVRTNQRASSVYLGGPGEDFESWSDKSIKNLKKKRGPKNKDGTY